MSVPTRFWVTAGIGESDVSELVAMDKAYMECGLGYQNHVIVSSIPPINQIHPRILKDKGVTYVTVDNQQQMIPFSSIIYVVRALNSGKEGETLCSSISLAKITSMVEGEEIQCMLAYECTGDNLKNTELESLAGLIDMVQERQATVDENWGTDGYATYSSSLEVKQRYGCSVVFVVFDPFTYQK